MVSVMLKKNVLEKLNFQINRELYSAYLYYAMAAYFDEKSLAGFSHWMKLQAMEEMTHAQKLYQYVFERGGKVVLDAIEAPPQKWKSPLAVFEEVYKHEVKVTGLINELMTLAKKENDYATEQMLLWFIDEQVEEEAAADEVVQKLKLVKEGSAIYLLDQELGGRVFTPPMWLNL